MPSDRAEIRTGQLDAEVERLRGLLRDAAQSLRTISEQAGKDPYMTDFFNIRGYANSRAVMAEEGLKIDAELGEK